ncbi:MAG: hypothetical protein JW808_05320, partial [Victivallales bacterium]|nr:hypothetical protein [Victivallales bacterium]
MSLHKLCPVPHDITFSGEVFPVPKSVNIQICNPQLEKRLTLIAERLDSDLPEICGISTNGGYPISLSLGESVGKPEGYCLKIEEGRSRIVAEDFNGLQHGCQTMLQLFALNDGEIEACE